MRLTEESCEVFLDKLASSAPTPGGGGAAALAGSIAAALSSMVANLTIGKKNYVEVEEEAKQVLAKTENLRKEILTLVEEDAKVFDKFMSCYKMPKETQEDKKIRQEAIEETAKQAAIVPLNISKLCKEILEVSAVAVKIGNKNAITDVTVAGLLARAALRSANYNVSINLSIIKDTEFVDQLAQEMNTLEKEALEFENIIVKVTEERM